MLRSLPREAKTSPGLPQYVLLQVYLVAWQQEVDIDRARLAAALAQLDAELASQ